MAVDYLRVYALLAPFIMLFFALDNYLRICGRVRYSMGINVFTSLVNIVLDALFPVSYTHLDVYKRQPAAYPA